MFLQHRCENNVGVMTDMYNSYTTSVQTFATIEKERLPVTVDAAVLNNNIVSNSYLYGLQIIIFSCVRHKILFF